MMTMAPDTAWRVSVVIPTYNRRDLTLRAVQSVLQQDFTGSLQVIVVDDGSSDGTREALRLRHAGDARVQVLESPRVHASAARNVGFAAASGELVCFLDSDDYWLPGLLAACCTVFALDPALMFVSVDGGTLASAGRPALDHVVAGDAPGWRHPRFPHERFVRSGVDLAGGRRVEVLCGDFFPAIVNGDLFYLSGMLMRSAAARRAGPFNERFRYFNDWEFFARLCLTGPGAYVDCDGFRRDTGRADQISRSRPPTAMARRHLFILRTLGRRSTLRVDHSEPLRRALRDAEYRMAHCLAVAGRRRRAEMYLFRCIQCRHKRVRCLLRLAALYVLPGRRARSHW